MKRFIFAGSRLEVFLRMLQLGIKPITVFATKNSRLENFLIKNGYEYKQINDKNSLITDIKNLDFDYLISNGLPYILPISELKKGNDKEFINIHPSYLPDLKGRNPVNGAILFKRNGGVTCHYMDDGIDTGDIIAQIKIPYSEDLDAGLLYLLSFNAEAEVFQIAYENNFKKTEKPKITEDCIYYTIKDGDETVDLEKDSIETILSKVKAFCVSSKYATLNLQGNTYKLMTAEIVSNDYVLKLSNKYKNFELMFSYDNVLIIKKDNQCLKFRYVTQ